MLNRHDRVVAMVLGWTLALLCVPRLAGQELPANLKKYQLRGRVLDGQGRLVAGARVHGSFRVTRDARSFTDGIVKEQTTDERGEFRIEFVQFHKGLLVRLGACHGPATTEKHVEVFGEGLTEPIMLRIDSRNARALAVRTVDERGEPVTGARVSARYRPTAAAHFKGSAEPLVANDGGQPLTDAEGSFTSSRTLDPVGSYQVEVKADGFVPAMSAWKDMGNGNPLLLDTVVVPRIRLLEGRVLDRTGKPVAGAHVVRGDCRQWAESVSDEEGRFHLRAAILGPGYVFVRNAGFRFHGQRCDAIEPLEVKLLARDETPVQRMATVPLPSLPERKALAAILAAQADPAKLLAGNDDERFTALKQLAQAEPGSALEELEKRPLKSAWFDSYVRREAAKRVMGQDIEEARSIVDSMKDASFRARGYLDLHDALPAGKRAEKIALLNQALLHSQGEEAADHRLLTLREVARRLWVLGDRARATGLLREGEAIARQLPTDGWPGYARGAFAEDLALIDLPAALALMKGLKDSFEVVRHHGNLACKLATSSPADAERVFDLMQAFNERNQVLNREHYAVRLCWRLAPKDLPRARRIAESIQTWAISKARAHVVMAQALAKSDPAAAKAMIDETLALLNRQAAAGEPNYNGQYMGAVCAAVLLEVAEAIDPDLVLEVFWQALALGVAPPAGKAPPYPGTRSSALGTLALLVARYDHAIARHLIHEASREPHPVHGHHCHILAAALVDPQGAAAMFDQITDAHAKKRIRNTLLAILSSEDDARWRAAHVAAELWDIEREPD